MRLAAIALVASCGFPHPDQHGDAAPTADHGDAETDDASTTLGCTSWSPFSAPQLVVDLLDPESGPSEPAISADGLDMVFSKQEKLFEVVRTQDGNPWSTEAVEPGFASFNNIYAPTFEGDRLHLLYIGGVTLYRASRVTRTAPFDAPGTPLFQPASAPTVTSGGELLVYQSHTTGGDRLDYVQYDPVTHAQVGSGTLLVEAGFDNTSPTIGEHGRTLIWARAAHGSSVSRLMIAELTGTTLGPATDLGLNPGTATDSGPSLDDAGAQLFYTSLRLADYDSQQLYTVRRTCNSYDHG